MSSPSTSQPGRAATLSAVVPTLGRSPWLQRSIDALRADVREALGSDRRHFQLILVAQECDPTRSLAGVDRRLDLRHRAGFAVACNLGIGASQGPYLALCNDDAIVQPGWASRLLEALGSRNEIASVQGLNLLGTPQTDGSPGSLEPRIDGAGLAWNRRWQAVQPGHGQRLQGARRKMPLEEVHEVFGVSATAALYRRAALDRVATMRRQRGDRGGPFAERLVAYYEDVELAGRLRSLGYRSLVDPTAIAYHAGSVTGATLGAERWRWIYGNRYLALADLLGRGFWPRVPALVGRDALELARAFFSGPPGCARGIASGWQRALTLLPAFSHLGPARVTLPRRERSPARSSP